MNRPEYDASGRETPLDDLTSYLIPDTPASLLDSAPQAAPEAAAEPSRMPSTAELLAAWELQQASAALVVPAAPERADSGPLVPRWALRAALGTVGLSAAALLVAFVVWGVGLLLDAAATALEHAAPWIGGGTVALLLLVLLCRKRPQGESLSVSVTQSVRVVKGRK